MDTKNRRKGDRRAVKDLPARKTQDVNRDAAEAHHETIERRCARVLLRGIDRLTLEGARRSSGRWSMR